MVPRSDTDGGRDAGFDERALYVVVRKAVRDAILGVIGTLLLVGIAFVVVWIGITTITATTTPLGMAFGAIAIVWGTYIAAATLEIVPPVRDWF